MIAEHCDKTSHSRSPQWSESRREQGQVSVADPEAQTERGKHEKRCHFTARLWLEPWSGLC
jgi:hypothetical protein